jgi:hypothetical protein
MCEVPLRRQIGPRGLAGSEDVMRAQVQSLREVSSRPNVRLGVIPESRAVDVVAGTAFHLYDDTAASSTRTAAWTPSSARTLAPICSARSAIRGSVTACRIASARPAAVSRRCG